MPYVSLEQAHLLGNDAVVLAAIAGDMCQDDVAVGLLAAVGHRDDVVSRSIFACHWLVAQAADASIPGKDDVEISVLNERRGLFAGTADRSSLSGSFWVGTVIRRLAKGRGVPAPGSPEG